MRCLRFWCTVCLILWSVSTLHAAQPTDGIPDSASVVIRWKTPEASLKKVGEFLDGVQSGVGQITTMMGLPFAGQVIGNPSLVGLDSTQDWWMIVFAESDAIVPSVVYIVAAKNVDAMKEALGEDFEIHVDGKQVIYSEDEDALAKVREQLKGNGKSLWSKTDAYARKLFDAADLSVLVNVRQLTEEYENEINAALPRIDGFWDLAKSTMPEDQQEQMAVFFEMYKDLGKAAIEAVRQSDTLALGLSVTKTAIRYESSLQIEKGSATAAFLAKQPMSDFSLIGRLPPDKSSYFGLRADFSSAMDWTMKMNKLALKPSAADATKIDDAAKEMAGLKFEDMVGYFDVAPTAPAMRFGSVWQVTPAQRMRKLNETILKLSNNFDVGGIKQSIKQEPGFDKIDGVEIDRITYKQEYQNDPTGAQEKVREVMFGDDGMEQVLMYQTNRMLQVTGEGKEGLQSLASGLAATAAQGSPVAAARQRLVEKANVVALVNVAKLILNGVKLVAASGSVPIDATVLDGVKVGSTFVGFSLSYDQNSLRSQIDIPVSQVQKITEVVKPLFEGRQ